MTLFMYMICSYYGLRMFLDDMIHILMCHYHCNLLERERGRESERGEEGEGGRETVRERMNVKNGG